MTAPLQPGHRGAAQQQATYASRLPMPTPCQPRQVRVDPCKPYDPSPSTIDPLLWRFFLLYLLRGARGLLLWLCWLPQLQGLAPLQDLTVLLPAHLLHLVPGAPCQEHRTGGARGARGSGAPDGGGKGGKGEWSREWGWCVLKFGGGPIWMMLFLVLIVECLILLFHY